MTISKTGKVGINYESVVPEGTGGSECHHCGYVECACDENDVFDREYFEARTNLKGALEVLCDLMPRPFYPAKAAHDLLVALHDGALDFKGEPVVDPLDACDRYDELLDELAVSARRCGKTNAHIAWLRLVCDGWETGAQVDESYWRAEGGEVVNDKDIVFPRVEEAGAIQRLEFLDGDCRLVLTHESPDICKSLVPGDVVRFQLGDLRVSLDALQTPAEQQYIPEHRDATLQLEGTWVQNMTANPGLYDDED